MSRRLQVLLLALVLVLAATDFLRRVHVGRDAGARQFGAPPAVVVPPAVSPEQVRGELGAWMPPLRSVPGFQADAASAAPAAWTLTLLGIFDTPRGRVAVVRADQAGGGASERLRLAVGEEFQGLRVTEIGHAFVQLEAAGARETLRLFDRESPGAGTVSIAAATPPGTPAGPSGPLPAAPPPAASPATRPPVTTAAPATTLPQPQPSAAAPSAPAPVRKSAAKGIESQTPQQVQPGAPLQLPWNLPMSNPEEFAKDATAAGAGQPATAPAPDPAPVPEPRP